MAKSIPLTKGYSTVIDDADFDLVSKFLWSAVTIPLTKGYHAVVDWTDKQLVEQFVWSALVLKHKDGSVRTVYATRNVKTDERRKNDPSHFKYTKQYMHRLIAGVTDPKIDVDHHDHDGLNNRRSNLRVCGRTSNNGNRRKRQGSSRFKGVYRNKANQNWTAQITKEGVPQFIGSFSNEVEAARAYDREAIAYFGEFAATNFPVGGAQ